MKYYVYRASLVCERCGLKLRSKLKAPALVEDESTYDSNDFPKGPYNSGPESAADTPQHCDGCGIFLKNNLTGDGVDYVCSAIDDILWSGSGKLDIVSQWYREYKDLIDIKRKA